MNSREVEELYDKPMYTDLPIQRDLLGRPTKSYCGYCSKVVHIEHDTENTLRRDKKRVFHPDDDNGRVCLLRCSGCSRPVSDYVEGAEFGEHKQ